MRQHAHALSRGKKALRAYGARAGMMGPREMSRTVVGLLRPHRCRSSANLYPSYEYEAKRHLQMHCSLLVLQIFPLGQSDSRACVHCSFLMDY